MTWIVHSRVVAKAVSRDREKKQKILPEAKFLFGTWGQNCWILPRRPMDMQWIFLTPNTGNISWERFWMSQEDLWGQGNWVSFQGTDMKMVLIWVVFSPFSSTSQSHDAQPHTRDNLAGGIHGTKVRKFFGALWVIMTSGSDQPGSHNKG